MTNRIDQTFARLRTEGKKGFIAYITGGDPDLERSLLVARALVAAGIDVLEIGLPFSDPLADGVVNQLSAQRALLGGTNIPKLLAMIAEFRRGTDVPVVIYSYLNPVFNYGFDRFHRAAAAAGVDGMLLLDLPPEEAMQNEGWQDLHGLRRILLIAPTTPPERISKIASAAEGFIYYVSREGVTGEQTSMATSIATQFAQIRTTTSLPVAVGFGISTPDLAAEAAQAADAVVVGSAIVKRIEQFASEPDLAERIRAFVAPMVQAVKNV